MSGAPSSASSACGLQLHVENIFLLKEEREVAKREKKKPPR
jgi:hypothetical protein